MEPIITLPSKEWDFAEIRGRYDAWYNSTKNKKQIFLAQWGRKKPSKQYLKKWTEMRQNFMPLDWAPLKGRTMLTDVLSTIDHEYLHHILNKVTRKDFSELDWAVVPVIDGKECRFDDLWKEMWYLPG
jgi:hypothetical protein